MTGYVVGIQLRANMPWLLVLTISTLVIRIGIHILTDVSPWFGIIESSLGVASIHIFSDMSCS